MAAGKKGGCGFAAKKLYIIIRFCRRRVLYPPCIVVIGQSVREEQAVLIGVF
jgi:hypothetical protein